MCLMPFHGLQDLVWVLPEAGPGLYLSLHQARGAAGREHRLGWVGTAGPGLRDAESCWWIYCAGISLAVNPGGLAVFSFSISSQLAAGPPA